MKIEVIFIEIIGALVIFAAAMVIMYVLSRKKRNTAFAEANFTVTYKFYTFLLDENSKQWTTETLNHFFSISDITGIDYEENGESMRKEGMLKQVMTNSAVSRQVTRIEMVIYTKDPKYPTVRIPLTYSPTSTNSSLYLAIKADAETFIGRMKQLTGNNDIYNESAPATSAADEIQKYKNLLDSGAITQEEYDKKKSELLNL